MVAVGRSGRLPCMRPLRGRCEAAARPLQDPCGANAIIMHHLEVQRPTTIIPTGSTSLMHEMLRYASGIACCSLSGIL